MSVDSTFITPPDDSFLPPGQWDTILAELCASTTEAQEPDGQAEAVAKEDESKDVKGKDVKEQILPSIEQLRIDDLNKFLVNAIGHLLVGQQVHAFPVPSLKEELQKHLDACKQCLTQTDELIFLRHLAHELISGVNFFEIECSKRPLHLPVPVSLSWMPGQTLRITIENPGLLLLIRMCYVNDAFDDYCLCSIKNFIRMCAVENPETLDAKHTIIFRQAQLEYQLNLDLLQVFYLFFPQQFVDVVKGEKVFERVFTPYSFGLWDVRFRGQIPGEAFVVDNLIAGDWLASFPNEFYTTLPVREKIKFYLSLLLHYGYTKSGPNLQDEIVHSIIKTATRIFETSADLQSERLLAHYVYDTLKTMESSNPQLYEKIQKTIRSVQPAHYDLFLANKPHSLLGPPNGSFLLRDCLKIKPLPQKHSKRIERKEVPATQSPLKRSCLEDKTSVELKRVANFIRLLPAFDRVELTSFLERFSAGGSGSFTCEFTPQMNFVAGSLLLQGLLSRQGGLHIVVSLPFSGFCKKTILNTVIYPAMRSAVALRALGSNFEAVLQLFVTLFTMRFGKSDSDYDRALLSASTIFPFELFSSRLGDACYTREQLKNVLICHFTEMVKGILFTRQRQQLVQEVKAVLHSMVETTMKKGIKGLPLNQAKEFFLYFNVENEVENLPSFIRFLYEVPFEAMSVEEAKIVNRAYFELSQKLIRCLNPVTMPPRARDMYPESEWLQKMLMFHPLQVIECRESKDLTMLLNSCWQHPNMPLIAVISPEFLYYISDFSIFRRPIHSLIFYEENSYKEAHGRIAEVKNLISQLHKTNYANTPSPTVLSIFTNLGIEIISTSRPQVKAGGEPGFTLVPLGVSKPVEAIQPIIKNGISHPAEVPIQGFFNKNSTCFINSALQALFCVPSFIESLRAPLLQDRKQFEELYRALVEVVKCHRTKTEVREPLEELLTQLFEQVEDIRGQRGAFHDVVPVLEKLLEVTGYKLQWDEVYRGLADNAHLIKTDRRDLFVLPIPMRANSSLQALFDEALSIEEKNDPDNKWRASTPQGHEVELSAYTTQHILVEPLPDFLVIQLKRWSFDASNMPVKDTNPIVMVDALRIGAQRFRLKACIHQDHELMHYYAETSIDGNWYRCDDTHIELIKAPDPANAYVYIFEKIV